jgi:hypothetical protein
MEDAGQEWVLNRRLNGGSHDGTMVASAVYCVTVTIKVKRSPRER